MRYHALACDYDGTLARHGHVEDRIVAALEQVSQSGRRLLLVTGRQLTDLERAFPHLDLFDRVVAENGALLYRPETREETPLADTPPPGLVALLRERGVDPLAVGRVIVATWQPHETAVLEAIRELGLEWQVIFNKGAVMALPSGVNKATGLQAALRELGLSPHNVVGVGDAENDHAFLSQCECAVVVSNALPSLKKQADWVTPADHGDGVVELIERLLASDLEELAPALSRHAIPLGHADGRLLTLDPYGPNVLVAGTSGSGKSTFTTGILERIAERGYQYCIIDPEGDYENLGVVSFGDAGQPPAIDQAMQLLEQPDEHAVINLLGVSLEDRPRHFETLFSRLLALRARTGRPHWIVVDEAHHMLPEHNLRAGEILGPAVHGLLFITVHPDHMAHDALAVVDHLLVIGNSPADTLGLYAKTAGVRPPRVEAGPLAVGEALYWAVTSRTAPLRFTSIPSRTERRRHTRKYAEGELPPDRSFYFRGPQGRLNLRAQNLAIFLQSAEGVDDDTWVHHLRRGDYSRWLREAIKDESLADDVSRIERMPEAAPRETRKLVRQQIEKRYSAPP